MSVPDSDESVSYCQELVVPQYPCRCAWEPSSFHRVPLGRNPQYRHVVFLRPEFRKPIN